MDDGVVRAVADEGAVNEVEVVEYELGSMDGWLPYELGGGCPMPAVGCVGGKDAEDDAVAWLIWAG